MAQIMTLPLPGTLGNVTGAGSDGVVLGALTFDDPDTALLKSRVAASGLCITEVSNLYTNETTAFNENTADDVEVIDATPTGDDANYFGHATSTFGRLDVNITTKAVSLVADVLWQYWNGSAWTGLSGVTDGTEGWAVDATGVVSVTFTVPSDWAKCTVDNVNGYWIRSVLNDDGTVTTPPQVGQGWIILDADDAVWTDDTTDFTDAGAGDVDLLPSYPIVGDGFYIGYSEKFCKVKVVTSQERTGTATISLKYWDGSAWSAVTTVEDDSTGYSETAGTHIIHFIPPTDWTANTADDGPNGEAGYFVVMEMTAITDVTQQPQATRGYVLPYKTGASGYPIPGTGRVTKVNMNAQTASASNADSKFILANVTKGTFDDFTWTQADACDNDTVSLYCNADDEIAVVQVTEDGTTEFADASLQLTYS